MKVDHNYQSGQATVEIALVIPILAVFLLLVVHVGIVIRQHVLVTHASREAARVLSVENNSNRAKEAARRSVSDAQVTITRPSSVGSYLTVLVTDEVENPIPFIGIVLPDIRVQSRTTMRVEK